MLRRMPALIDAPFIVSEGVFVNPKFRGYRLPHDEETYSIQRGEHLRKQIKVHNARALPLSRSARLHTTGFELFEAPFHLNFQISDTDTTHFYEHCEKLIKDVAGCIEAKALHHVYRDGVGYGTAGAGHYATSIHSDYSPCVENITNVPKGHHFGLYTVWRSADSEQAIETMPLALCDRRTVAAADIVYANVRRRTKQRTPVIECRLIHDLGQGWYYFPQMTPDEVLVFNQYDTRQKKANLRTTFHGAIKVPKVREDAPLRRTIEVRVLAIFEDLDLDSERRRAMYQAQVPSILYDGTVSKWRHESMID